jgi:2',3'-cyclic-nucleotide 2'-phosphodiesterase (5'-nucleotidase family)
MAIPFVRALSVAGAACAAAFVCAVGPDKEAWGPGQAAADQIRAAAKAQIAFLPAGMLKADFRAGELSKLLQFPTDEVAVVSLTGDQVRSALERSVSLLPSPNSGFLQVSGIQVTFAPKAPTGSRIREATVAGAALQPGAKYLVAMPASLARGGLGYFTVWNKDQIVEVLASTTLETVLKGKTGNEPTPRWRAV